MTTAPEADSIITDPEMEGTYFGIAVACIGEDGDMLALGHHDPRRALAAFNRHARESFGYHNLADDPQASAADWLDATEQRWVIFRAPDPENTTYPQWIWHAESAREDAPHARPVTFLRVW
ncbi:hypothetical protein [Streptomyces sp. NPDC046371]|uniref:hypothetical protein n=1 Tax=Streptomyces sp. NPDC046371 TaxID=3154916 RepID=UPI0033DCB9E3